MKNLDLEISRINRLLPNVEIDEIKSFMISVPKRIENLRVPLTLVHFYRIEDKNTIKLQNENNAYANLIHDLFPMYSVNKLVKKLSKYGNISERCRLVVRNILRSREEEFNSALNQVSPSAFCERFGKQGPLDHQNNDNYKVRYNPSDTDTKANEEMNVDSPSCTSSYECQESGCHNEPTLVFNDQHRLNNFYETVVRPSTSSEVEAPTFYKYFNTTAYSESQRTNSKKSPFLWNVEASDEKPHPELSNYRQHQEETCSSDSNQSCLGANSYIIESQLNELIGQSNVGFERNYNRTSTYNSVYTSPTFNHSSHNVDISPQPSPSFIRNIINCEEPTKLSSKKKYPFQSSSNEPDPESLIWDTDRKKIKESHYQKDENEDVPKKKKRDTDVEAFENFDDGEGRELDYISDSSESEPENTNLESFAEVKALRILINSPRYEQPNANDMYRNISFPHTFESEVESNKMKKIEPKKNMNNKVVYRVMEIFPDADPDYIRQMYAEISHTTNSEETLRNSLIENILSVEYYPKRPPKEPSTPVTFDLESQLQTITEFLPDADPSYLRMKVSELPPDELTTFIDEALETKNYPTLKEYLRKQQLSAQKRQYTVDFSVEDFVKLVPNPKETFLHRNIKINKGQEDWDYAFQFFKNKFNRISVRNINNVFYSSASLYDCYNSLTKIKETIKSYRSRVDMSKLTCSNIPLLQELAFIDHEKEILSYIEDLKKKKKKERMRIKKEGLMLTCSCCFDDEVMPDDTHRCSNNCVFCKGCIIKSVEVAFGEGKLVFPCLGDCGSHFSLQNLQNVLPPNLFSKIAQKHAVAEVKAARIEDLEFCPFCDFATIVSGPPETNKIFVCLNPECLKESCRLCKEPSHIPLRCDEVENDDEVKKRVYIENRMTEALLRKCPKCGVSFYKEEGCNKMTCSCGATMCYICGQPVTDYKHFNGLGGDKYELCPLYSDTIAINKQNVLEGAEAAKEELGVEGTAQLKNDPTSDVQKHYEERAKQLPAEPHMEHLQMLNHMARAIAIRDPPNAVHIPVPAVMRNAVRVLTGQLDRRQIIHARRASQQQHHRHRYNCPCAICLERRQ